eukprot:2806984-Ditylum_brightwellii.AAC.1
MAIALGSNSSMAIGWQQWPCTAPFPRRGYIDPEIDVMDRGFTEHSSCPVIKGEQKIVTQWVCLGVTKQTPWTAYNTRTPLSA